MEDIVKEKPNRFLLTLCILTLVGSGIQLFAELGYLFFSKVSFGLTESFLFCSLLPTVVCIVGAILMVKLKRIGFFIYVIAEIFPHIYTFSTTKMMLTSPEFAEISFQTHFALHAGIVLSIHLAFVIMYAFNYKHLK